ncbi:MAG: outer membrane beta-barrel protein [Hyphomicrobium sp.]|jgi:outer membrane immunogenic protein
MLARTFYAFSAIAALSVAPAFAEAADLGPYKPQKPSPAYIPPPPPPPLESNYDFAPWTGAYWGFSAGYGWGQSIQDYERNANHGLSETTPEGALGAFTLGYNLQMPGGIVLGVESDIGLMDISADDKVVYDGHIFKSDYGPWWGTLRGRLGLAAGHTLFYGTGGAAFMDVDEVSIGNTPGETAVNESFRTGWVLGGGIEQALGAHMTAKVEYLHMDFGSFEGLSGNAERYSFDNQVDLVRAGINYKF